MRKITVVCASGIGDFSWSYSKLVNLGVEINVRIADAGPPRLATFLDLLPAVSSYHPVRMSFAALRARALPGTTSKGMLLAKAPGTPLMLDPNIYLEHGKRLETWIPDLPTDFHYRIDVTQEQKMIAVRSLPVVPYVCLFAANETTARTWNGWLENEWVEFMMQFRARIADIAFVLIGAAWDVPLANKIDALAKQSQLPMINLVNQLHIGSSIHVLKHAEYVVAFPSGIGVLSNIISSPSTMFYPDALVKMIGTWGDPKDIESNRLHECTFSSTPPVTLVDWLCDVYQIKSKL